jgi:4-methyl-5(b-hydroxyethyl)-thiazole monophosphate biosynthesis
MSFTASPKILIPVANGSEDIEVIALADILRRGGCEVTLASVQTLQITLARKTTIIADSLIEDCQTQEFDAIICPGGMPGAEHLRDSEILKSILFKHLNTPKWFGAICAAPNVVLNSWGLIHSIKATAFGPHLDKLPHPINQRVVVDQNCITSRGAGTTEEFAITWLKVLCGEEIAENVRTSILAREFEVSF